MHNPLKLKLPALALAVAMASPAFATYNPNISAVYSFGDSLSDMGAMQDMNRLPMLAGQSISSFTTPGGLTAAGHLARTYGQPSTAALRANPPFDITRLETLVPLLRAANPASAMARARQLAEAQQKVADQLQPLLSQLPTTLTRLDELTEPQKLIFKELQRRLLLNDPDYTPVSYRQTDGNNFAIGGATALAKSGGSGFPLQLSKTDLEAMLTRTGLSLAALETAPLADTLSLNMPMQQPALADQVNRYLDRDGRANARTLYTITAGANDLLRAQSILKLIAAGAYNQPPKKAGSSDLLQAQNELKKTLIEPIILGSAQEVARQSQRLLKAGARYVVVTNMPDISDTPRFQKDRQAIRQQAMNQARAQSATLTNAQLSHIADQTEAQLLAESRQAVNGFNRMLQTALSASPVIYVDISRFLKIVKANPRRFGFDPNQINQPFCEDSSLLCSPADKALQKQLAEIDNNKTLTVEQRLSARQKQLQQAAKSAVFADDIHPSSATHKYLADIISNGYLQAPGYHASLQSLARTGQTGLARLFEDQRLALTSTPPQEGELTPTVNITASQDSGPNQRNLIKGKVNSTQLYASVAYGISSSTRGAIMLSVQRDRQQFSNDRDGNQQRQAYVSGISLAQTLGENWSWGINGYLGQGNYRQVRYYSLGDGITTPTRVTVRNSGQTESLMAGAGLGAYGRYQWAGVRMQPRLGLDYQYERLRGYAETTDLMGAVRFDDARSSSTELTLGLNLSKPLAFGDFTLIPYMDLAWRQALADNDLQVNWKVADSSTGYIQEDIALNDNRFATVQLGSQVDIIQDLDLRLNYSHRFASPQGRNSQITLAMGYRF